MKKFSWYDIRQALSQAPLNTRQTNAKEFWQDFRARAVLYPQIQAEKNRTILPTYRWSFAIGFAMFLLTVVWIPLMFRSGEAAASTITSLDISADHSAVIILNEGSNQATFVWIADMQISEINGAEI
ncbi:MAG: hypothetical protein JXN60_01920 [Lentisphaerae bacterium]|nr:hypothetical protein [Lentisphaerota bacterium]